MVEGLPVLNQVASGKRRIALGRIDTRFVAAGHAKNRNPSRKLVDNGGFGHAFCRVHWGDKMVAKAHFSGLFAIC
jgi:hypothetical protein